MQNILKRNNMQKYFVTFLQGYPLKTFFPIFKKNIEIFPLEPKFLFLSYVQDHSASFDMNIEKRGGGSERYRLVRNL